MSWIGNTPPIGVGQADANGNSFSVLGEQYRTRVAVTTGGPLTVLKAYKMVKNNSGGILTAGMALIEQYTNGAPNGLVTTTTTVSDPAWAGIVPAEFGSNTVAANAYFLMQIAGPGRPQFAHTASIVTATASNGAALGTASTAGWVQLLIGTATGTAAGTLNDVGIGITACLGMATNSAAVASAGALGYAILRMKP